MPLPLARGRGLEQVAEKLAGCSKRSRCEAAPDGRTRGVLRLANRAGGEVSGPGDPGERERATSSVRPRAPYLRRWAFFSGLLGGAGGDAVLLELLPERVPVDAEELGGADLVSLGLAHDGAQQRLLHEPDHEGVQVG